MQGKDFIYLVQNELSQYYYIDGMGNLQVASNPVPLEFTPDGWQEISILTEKNKKYFALDRMYGAPQGFVEDGGQILKKLFYGKSIEETVYLVILEQQLYFTDTEYGYYYSQLVRCEIDISTVEHDGPKVTANILEGDITRALKANEGTAYEIDIDVPQAEMILMDGLGLVESVQAIMSQTTPQQLSVARIIPLEFAIATTEQKSKLGTQDTNISTIVYSSDAQLLASKRNILANTIATDVPTVWDFRAQFKWSVGSPAGNNIIFAWRVFDASGVVLNDPSYVLQTVPIAGGTIANQTFQLTGSKTVSLPGNCKAFLVAVISDTVDNNTGAIPTYTFTFDSTVSTGDEATANLRIDYNYRFASSKIKGLTPAYVFQQLVSKLTNGKYGCSSTLLDNLDPYLLLTSGDGARGLAGAKLKTSMADFFGFINMRFGVGMGVEKGRLVLEKKSYWTLRGGADEIQIGEGAKLKTSWATDYLFASFKIGYANQTYDTALGDINGRYEFNMTHTYVCPQTRVNTQLDLTTKYRADMYGLEYTRINLEGKTTTDGSSDNDVFAIHVTKDTIKVVSPSGAIIDTGYHALDRTINPYSVGLLDSATAFNLKLSPKWCLDANGDYLHSCLDNMENKKITFSTADKDVELAVTLPDGTVIEERADVRISSLAPQLFRPYKFEFLIPDRVNLFSQSQRKVLRMTYNQGAIQLGGYALKTGSQPANDAAQNYSLLCSPDTDVTQLEDVYE